MIKKICGIYFLIFIYSFAAYEEFKNDSSYEETINLYSGSSYFNNNITSAIGLNLGTTTGLNLVYNNISLTLDSRILSITNPTLALSIDSISKDDFFTIDSGIPFHYGIGIKLTTSDNTKFGFRGLVGSSIRLSDFDENLELYGDFIPTFYLPSYGNFLVFEFAIGFRYYLP
ncbi:hypothetical protein EV215_1464 [Hypnocyclicus thermotrophus]|uniref:Uncharacterized protein n=1 Tax=Hypnocyclicus thermotrophus TaxID=1627895 RepID=A0AA46I570_9FUSO|nr:hypothetical protein [Hypnocyclicus thermotrophus]TDT69122.1 hypothetical protein EV215_1464 [Hypnocyclicus thermotrophus]